MANIFQRSRFNLTLLYAGVMGGILLLLGAVAHGVMDRVSERVINRELELLFTTVNGELQASLKEPGKIDKPLSNLCFVQQPCYPGADRTGLVRLVDRDYHLQFLDLRGNPVAAVAEDPMVLGANPLLIDSQDVRDRNGIIYHVHIMELSTVNGKPWGYLQVGRSLQKFDNYMTSLHLLIAFGIPLAMLLIGGASWWLSGIAMQPIYRSYERMQRFTLDASHELRTPVAAIQATLEVALAEKDVKPSTLQTLKRQSDRLSQLARDLLLLARLDDSASTKTWKSVSLNELIQDLEEELASLAIAQSINLSSHIQAPSLYVQGNPEQLYRLISNLIQNAIKYTPPQGSIVVSLFQDKTTAIITVRDSGHGISELDLAHIFDRFYRVTTDRDRKTGGCGTGIGDCAGDRAGPSGSDSGGESARTRDNVFSSIALKQAVGLQGATIRSSRVLYYSHRPATKTMLSLDQTIDNSTAQ
ncbi:MAG: two-component sensor histidine kinase [Alkalinema sp. RU_4_3]|nr:two-component sensor histidine kinase [Alkalinema sp. RU_4_3]